MGSSTNFSSSAIRKGVVMQDLVNLVGRVLMAVIFVLSGFQKLTHYANTQQYLEHAGIPGALLPLVILMELGGGIALVLGAYTRIIAFLLAGFCLLTAVMVHYHPGDQAQMINFMKNLAMCGGFLILTAYGAGKLSLDGKLKLKWG
jgi:putative oxidoreductase